MPKLYVKYEDEYNDYIFWEELIDRLGERDFIKKYGVEKIKKMNWRERITKEYPFSEKYADEFEMHGVENLKIENQNGEESRSSEEKDDDEISNVKDEKYIKGFILSKYFADLSAELRKSAKGDVEFFLDCLNNCESATVKSISRDHIKFILTELFPKKVTALPEKFRDFVPILTAFFMYLRNEGAMKNADDIIEEIKECEEIMVENAASPECYGMSKMMAMQMLKDNVNMNDQNAVERWITKFNARPYEERDKMFTHLELPSIASKPSAKIGRNEFCPCGSGKKYKKCCGA